MMFPPAATWTRAVGLRGLLVYLLVGEDSQLLAFRVLGDSLLDIAYVTYLSRQGSIVAYRAQDGDSSE